MAGFSSIGRAIGGIAAKVPGLGGVLGPANKFAGKIPGLGGIAAGAAGALAPRPTSPQLGIATGSASETTATNPLGTPTPPGMPANMMSMAAQAAARARTRAQGANSAGRMSPNAVPTGRTRPLSMLGY